ncbi:MAG: protein kinase [Deltaproteobacteria bacterium]|nr:protein kinase [Deltaproteobacteria bacterium]
MSVELDETAPATRDSGPALPQRISKYEVGKRLGTGGNGVVMLARDVTLDRKVAIKLLRGAATEEASQRLLREAQAAAKLSHENVIIVHEVGTHEGGVFVAMEYVPGGTLRDYPRSHTWRETLDIYIRAGRGLAAAHAAGLVHRDFKPDNVLVGDDGRVRVTDFGLVSVSGTKAVSVESLDGKLLDTTLTRTGTVMGTPRYMAPEQHDGGTVDARADQFAFCVALYEALFHHEPFEGDTYETIATHVCEGAIVPPPADSPVPRPIRDAIVRGLAPDPDKRWPSVDALLDALAPRPDRRRRWWIAAIAAVLVVAAVTVFLVERRRHRETVEAVFDRAQDAYMHGDYEAAVAGWKRAFELDPDIDGRGAAYVYNMAASYEQLGKCPEAVRSYQRYLTLGTSHDDQQVVEKHLAELGDCKPHVETADEAYKKGETAYNAGDNATAAAAFKRGFALQDHWDDKSAAYLYNAGQAFRQMGNCADSAAAFKQYLAIKTKLDPKLRTEIEQRVKELDECAVLQKQAEAGSGSATR